ncbi:unnamed protein product [Ilex paraguariensis]|uniref:Uncharacterized protein n=1 Tax=Ilex paraguariensis TaxID=185542 RepID=A0ABC8QN32_9AQUA
MGALLLKKTCLLFLIISASILSTSFAGGRQSRFVNNSEKELGATQKVCRIDHNFRKFYFNFAFLFIFCWSF